MSLYANARGGRLPLAFNAFSVVSLLIIIGLPVLSVILFAIFPHFNEGSFRAPFSNLYPQLSDPALIDATFNSIRLATCVTLLSIAVAVVLAYVRNKMSVTAGRFWDVMLLVPFLIPPYIGSMAWIQMFQFNGVWYRWTGVDFSAFLFSFSGVVFVMTMHLFPLVYFSASNALRVIGQRYSDVARVYGAGRLDLACRILLPLMMPTLLASGLIVFVLSVEEFGTPDILGSRFGFEVMVTAIEEKLADWPIDLPGASVLSLILIAIAVSAYLLQLVVNRKYAASLDAQTITSAANSSRGACLVAHLLFTLVAVFAVILPLFSVVAASLMSTVSHGLSWDNLTLSAYADLFTSGNGAVEAIYTSLGLAAMTALIAAVLGLLVAFTLIRLKPRGKSVLDVLSLMPNAVPAMALSVGLILTWNQQYLPITPYNTMMILLLAYVCLMLPYPIRMITSALRQQPFSLDESAAIYGADILHIVRRVLLPLMVPIMVASGCIVFAISTRELVASLMLAPAGTETVATYVFNQFDQGSVSAGMAMSLVVILVSGALIALGQGIVKRYTP